MNADLEQRLAKCSTPKRRAWLGAYLGEAKGNATEAARIAGYKHPATQGDQVKGILENLGLLDPLATSVPIMDPDEILAALTEIAKGDVLDSSANPVGNRLKALGELAKIRGLHAPKKHDVEVRGNVGSAVFGRAMQTPDGRAALEQLAEASAAAMLEAGANYADD